MYSFQHTAQRFMERYGDDLSEQEYDDLVKIAKEKIEIGEYSDKKKIEKGLQYVINIPWKTYILKVTFETERNTITTLLYPEGKVCQIGDFYNSYEQEALNITFGLSRSNYVRRVFVLPDLTSATPCPVGTSVEVYKHIYPKWIGTDIGCGVSLFKLKDIDIDSKNIAKILYENYKNIKLTKNEKILSRQETGTIEEGFDDALGTIGGGNHFAELMVVEEQFIEDPKIDKDAIYLCVHSGSRDYGVFAQDHQLDECVKDTSVACTKFMEIHDDCVRWAHSNRNLIAKKFCKCANLTLGEKLYDITHNFIEKDGNIYIQRKGTIPSNRGPAMIPGSRGTNSYLVLSDGRVHSLPHGAGRKISRGGAKSIFSTCTMRELAKTDLGSYVVSRNLSLMKTEHPECYKDIQSIISNLESEYGVHTIARFKPLVTLKW